MMPSAREIFITGLRNAHAMEVQAREMIERQIERTSDYPEVRAKLQAHLEETHNQLRRLDHCLASCGEDASTLKDVAQSMTGNFLAMAHGVADDEILKNTFANNAFENFEIAAYKSLLAICDEAEAATCRQHLEASLRSEPTPREPTAGREVCPGSATALTKQRSSLSRYATDLDAGWGLAPAVVA
jgi:ferritin-like metal-binding protein YciE